MGHLTYLALLAGCLVVTAPLELVLRVRVYARWRRLLVAVVPEFVVFVAWVLYAIAQGHWDYSDARRPAPRRHPGRGGAVLPRRPAVRDPGAGGGPEGDGLGRRISIP
jgi:lycopene cyclase domain-containing protein